jgi:hypothetical protein
LHPMQDAAMKKSTLPTMPMDLYALGRVYSKAIIPFTAPVCVISESGHKTQLVDGEKLKRLDDIVEGKLKEDVYVAATCYVVEAKEFSYPKKNPTKKALKMILDADGYVTERVLWADYNTGVLKRPVGLKKGAIATIFLKKKIDRKEMTVQSVVIEAEAK